MKHERNIQKGEEKCERNKKITTTTQYCKMRIFVLKSKNKSIPGMS